MIDGDLFLNSSLAQDIYQSWPQLNNKWDPSSPFEFNNSYYKGLRNNITKPTKLYLHIPKTREFISASQECIMNDHKIRTSLKGIHEKMHGHMIYMTNFGDMACWSD